MEFIVTRTSLWGTKKPCEEAFKRDDLWVVNIESLEEFIKFKDKYGEIILTDDYDTPSIEIYDYYRE